MLRRWYSTVFTLTTSSPAISRLLRPDAASRATTSSWEVSTAGCRSRRAVGRSPEPARSAAQRSGHRRAARAAQRPVPPSRPSVGTPSTAGPAQELPGGELDLGALERVADPFG